MNRRQFLNYSLIGLALSSLKLHGQSPTNLYNPSRHAFIADKAGVKIAVVDIHQKRHIDTIKIPIPARILASSLDRPYLAFSDRSNRALYILNLQTREIRHYPLPNTVYRINFIPQSTKILLNLFSQIAILDHQTQQLDIIDKTLQNLYTRYNTIFSPYSQSLWVSQEKTSELWHYNLKTQKWRSIELNETRGLGMGAPSFKDEFIAINTYYADEGLLYYPKSEQTYYTGKMHNSRRFNQPLIEPYIDNNSEHAIFADRAGTIKIFHLKENHRLETLQIPYPPRRIRTGYLDQYLIISGDEHLSIHPFKALNDYTLLKFGYEQDVSDTWISGDSKTLLFGTTRSNELGLYDLQQQKRLPNIPLDLLEIGQIRMNTTNTICY